MTTYTEDYIAYDTGRAEAALAATERRLAEQLDAFVARLDLLADRVTDGAHAAVLRSAAASQRISAAVERAVLMLGDAAEDACVRTEQLTALLKRDLAAPNPCGSCGVSAANELADDDEAFWREFGGEGQRNGDLTAAESETLLGLLTGAPGVTTANGRIVLSAHNGTTRGEE